MDEFPQNLRCDLRLSIFQNLEISGKSLKCLELKAKAQQATQNENFDSCTGKLQKINYETFQRKTYLLNFENLSTSLYPRLYLPTNLSLPNYETTN